MAILASPFETNAPRARLSQWGSRPFSNLASRLRGALTYDVKGNLLTRPASLQSPALSLVWDFDNKLRGADTNGTPATLEVTYEFDALGRRVARSGPGGNMVYVQAGQQTIADYPRGGAPASATFGYVYGSYIDEPLLRETVTGSVRHFFHRNQQHSVTALTDNSGNTAERYAYTAHGALTVFNPAGTPQATSALNNRYTYTGRDYDPDLNLHHFRARLYDPTAGHFLGRDSLGFVDGMSVYRGYFAPTGLDSSGERKVCCKFGYFSAGPSFYQTQTHMNVFYKTVEASPYEPTKQACNRKAKGWIYGYRWLPLAEYDWACLNFDGYGRFCGLRRKAKTGKKNLGIDDVDDCCASHDLELDFTSYCNECIHQDVNEKFLDCLKNADCSNSPDPEACRIYRQRAIIAVYAGFRGVRFCGIRIVLP